MSRLDRIFMGVLLAIPIWGFEAFYIAGVYLDCIPNDPEYGCPSANQQLFQSIISVGITAAITLIVWMAIWRFGRRDDY